MNPSQEQFFLKRGASSNFLSVKKAKSLGLKIVTGLALAAVANEAFAGDPKQAILLVKLTPAGALITISNATPFKLYITQANENLATTNWVSISTNVAFSSGVVSFTDTEALNYSARFYRSYVVGN